MSADVASSHSEEAVYVYQAPVRLWHWANAGSILVLAITGVDATATHRVGQLAGGSA